MDALPGLAKGATVLVYGHQSGAPTPLTNTSFIFGQFTFRGFLVLAFRAAHPQKAQQYIQEMVEMIAAGKLDAKVQHAYALGEYKKAFEEQMDSKSGARTGKILFDLDKVAEE